MRLFALFTLLFALMFALSMRGRTPGEPAAGMAPQLVAAPAADDPQLAASLDTSAPAGNGFGTVTLERAPDSHFYLDMQVNGRAMRFLVDTGASSVALGRSDARALGLTVAPEDFTGLAQTANGPARIAPVRLDSMRAGPLDAGDVEAVVMDVEDGMPLLGQSFLRRLDEVSVRGDVMVLR